EGARRVLVLGQLPGWRGLGLATAAGAVVAMAGLAFFQRAQRGFAGVLLRASPRGGPVRGGARGTRGVPPPAAPPRLQVLPALRPSRGSPQADAVAGAAPLLSRVLGPQPGIIDRGARRGPGRHRPERLREIDAAPADRRDAPSHRRAGAGEGTPVRPA